MKFEHFRLVSVDIKDFEVYWVKLFCMGMLSPRFLCRPTACLRLAGAVGLGYA